MTAQSEKIHCTRVLQVKYEKNKKNKLKIKFNYATISKSSLRIVSKERSTREIFVPRCVCLSVCECCVIVGQVKIVSIFQIVCVLWLTSQRVPIYFGRSHGWMDAWMLQIRNEWLTMCNCGPSMTLMMTMCCCLNCQFSSQTLFGFRRLPETRSCLVNLVLNCD